MVIMLRRFSYNPRLYPIFFKLSLTSFMTTPTVLKSSHHRLSILPDGWFVESTPQSDIQMPSIAAWVAIVERLVSGDFLCKAHPKYVVGAQNCTLTIVFTI